MFHINIQPLFEMSEPSDKYVLFVNWNHQPGRTGKLLIDAQTLRTQDSARYAKPSMERQVFRKKKSNNVKSWDVC